MTTTEPSVERAPGAEHIRGRYTWERQARVRAGLDLRRRQRRARAWGLGMVLVGAAAALFLVIPRERQAPTQAAGPTRDDGTITLPDGSRILPLSDDASIGVESAAFPTVTVALARGAGRFEVTPHPTRTFQVQIGQLTVRVLGTVFEVTRNPPMAHVRVEHGRVEVKWPGGREVLTGGGEGWYRTEGGVETGEAETKSRPAPRPQRRVAVAPKAPSWREHAQTGEFAQAYELLKEKPASVRDDVADLLLAADAARLSGHPQAATPYLRRVIERHAGDSRASLAAFTLGRLLLSQLGDPRAAADAFASARRLAPSSTLAEDALAREVEAAHRAGDGARAQRLAKEYLVLYPDGRRSTAVKRHGGID